MRRFAFPAALALVAFLSSATHAQSREELTTAARAFDEGALRLGDDNARPTPLRKWPKTKPVILSFDNASAAPGLVELTRQAVKLQMAEAGVAVVDREKGDKSSNYLVLFDENGFNGQSGYCWGSAWWSKAFDITRAELRINPTRIRDIDRCAVHEPMHTLGFNSHPHAALSVLSYTYKGQRTLTPLDLHLIHTLYDDRLPAGTKPAEASQAACHLLGERMASSAADIAAVCSDRKGPVRSN
jgi:hypothetical protein